MLLPTSIKASESLSTIIITFEEDNKIIIKKMLRHQDFTILMEK